MIRIEAERLQEFVESLLRIADVTPEAATDIATPLVNADLCGAHSHGVQLVPPYVELAIHGPGSVELEYPIDPTATPTVAMETNTTARIDGRFAFGQLVGRRAIDVAIRKADEHGLGLVGFNDGCHIGRVGEWVEQACEAGHCCIAFVNGQGDGPVGPAGSAQGRLFTNPVAVGIPTFDALEFPIVLDMATSQVAHGQLIRRHGDGVAFPPEWVIDESGESVTDPDRFVGGEGAMLPLGGRVAGYKGFALATVTELLAGIIGNAPVAGHPDAIRSNAGMFFVFDPTAFSPIEEIEQTIAVFEEYLDETEFHEDVPAGERTIYDRAVFPGEPEFRITQRYRSEGIPMTEEHVGELCDLAIRYDRTDGLPDEFEEVFQRHRKRMSE